MIYPGIVSVTFRNLTPKEIIDLSIEAGLAGIEWGGDVHVPHGDTVLAREVYKMTAESGLKVAAYGSYYRLGIEKEEPNTFDKVLATAIELKAPVIRVWAGNKGSADADKEWWDKCIDESIQIAEMAQKEGIKVAYEYHQKTLTDTLKSCVKLLKSVNHENMRSYWQPDGKMSPEDRAKSLKEILPWLENLHVHYGTSKGRQPIASGREWIKYLTIAKQLKEDRFAMIEFVKDGTREQFLDDAKALKEFIELA